MLYKTYKRLYPDSNFIRYVKYLYKTKIKKILRIPYCTYMCIKYPFLYPRNRFTDKYRANILSTILYKIRQKSVLTVNVTGKLVKEIKDNDYYKALSISNEIHQSFNGTYFILNKKNGKIIIKNKLNYIEFDLKKILWGDNKFDVVDMSIKTSFTNHPFIVLDIIPFDKNDKTNYGFTTFSIELKLNKFFYSLYKALNWIDVNVLDKIFCLPTYTEWDAVEKGWNKAFGKQYLIDLKKQLKKDKMLYKWRITQIKEKWGRLYLYCNFASPELYKIIDKYETLSWNTCINCGKQATHTSINWISPYCEDCVKKSNCPENFNLL